MLLRGGVRQSNTMLSCCCTNAWLSTTQ